MTSTRPGISADDASNDYSMAHLCWKNRATVICSYKLDSEQMREHAWKWAATGMHIEVEDACSS